MDDRDGKEFLTEPQREDAEMEFRDAEAFLRNPRQAGAYPSIRELFAGYQGDGAVEIEATGIVGREQI